VMTSALQVLNMAEVLPFPWTTRKSQQGQRRTAPEVSLPRFAPAEMARNLRLRSKVATATRVFMEEQAFLEVETPTLSSPRPRARVSSYPLPPRAGVVLCAAQSPQQFKQILMVAGVERYSNSPAAIAMRISAPTVN